MAGTAVGAIVAIVFAMLLVVMVIVGILVAIAVPVFNSAAAQAKQKACFANQRVLRGAIELNAAMGGAPPVSMAELKSFCTSNGIAFPVCPAKGTYELETSDASPIITCSVHGAAPPQNASTPSP